MDRWIFAFFLDLYISDAPLLGTAGYTCLHFVFARGGPLYAGGTGAPEMVALLPSWASAGRGLSYEERDVSSRVCILPGTLFLQGSSSHTPEVDIFRRYFCGRVFAIRLDAFEKQRGFTFGDVGVMAYRHVMGMDEQPLVPDTKPRPKAAPHIADYSQIIRLGTYPPWSDPSYGYRATPFHFILARQLNRTHIVLRYYFDLFVMQLGPLLAGLLILFFLGDRVEFGKRALRLPVLWLPALAGLAFYASMRVDGRFLAGYIVALYAACVASIRLPNSMNMQKTIRSIAFAVSFLLLSQVAVEVTHEVIYLFGRKPHPDWLVAAELQQMGLKKGDRVSYMGYALVDHAWAHLARVNISAEIPEEDVLNFWASDKQERQDVINWLSSTAAKALIAKNVPASAMPMGWMRVADTDYYILTLSGDHTSTK